MSQLDKLKERLKAKPRDFTWQELTKLLNALGYREHEGSGSRKCFERAGFPKIRLHKPHPGNELKSYQVADVLKFLEENNLI